MKHLLFYDSTCPFCKRWIERIKTIDVRRKFLYLPLVGKRAHQMGIHRQDTMVLIENPKTTQEKHLIRGKAALRLFWLLGGKWKLLGLLYFLPIGADNIYSLIASHRHKFL